MICFRHAEAPHVTVTAKPRLMLPMHMAAAASLGGCPGFAAAAGAASPAGKGCWVTAHAGVGRLLGVGVTHGRTSLCCRSACGGSAAKAERHESVTGFQTTIAQAPRPDATVRMRILWAYLLVHYSV